MSTQNYRCIMIARAKRGDASRSEVESMAETAVYDAVVHLFEGLEGTRLRGNGHHMAQSVAEKAAKMVRERWIEETKGGAS